MDDWESGIIPRQSSNVLASVPMADEDWESGIIPSTKPINPPIQQQTDSQFWHNLGQTPEGYNYGEIMPTRTAINAPIIPSPFGSNLGIIPKGTKQSELAVPEMGRTIASGIGDILQQGDVNTSGNVTSENAVPDASPDAINAMASLGGVKPGLEGVGSIVSKLGETGINITNRTLKNIGLAPTLKSRPEISAQKDALTANRQLAYDNSKRMGSVLTPTASDHVPISVMAQTQESVGQQLHPDLHSQTIAALNVLKNKADQGLTTNDLESTRQTLNQIISSNSGTQQFAAIQARNALDNVYSQIEQNPHMLNNTDPSSVQSFRDARDATVVEKKHEMVANIILNARSNPQKIQNAMQKLLDTRKENDFDRFTPDEQHIIEKIAFPTGVDPRIEGGGVINSAIHKAGIVSGGVTGFLGGMAEGHPLMGAGIGAAGGASNTVRNTIKGNTILQGAHDLLDTIANKAKPIQYQTGQIVTPPSNAYERLGLPSPSTLSLPNPQYQSLTTSASRPWTSENGVSRPMTNDEWSLHTMSPSDQAARLALSKPQMGKPEIQQMVDANQKAKDWDIKYNQFITGGLTGKEANNILGKRPSSTPIPQDYGVEPMEIKARQNSISEYQKNFQNLKNQGLTFKEIRQKLGNQPENP